MIDGSLKWHMQLLHLDQVWDEDFAIPVSVVRTIQVDLGMHVEISHDSFSFLTTTLRKNLLCRCFDFVKIADDKVQI